MDEALAGYCTTINVHVGKDDVVTVSDDARGIPTDLVEHLSDAPTDGVCVAVAGRTAPMTRELLGAAGTTVPDAAEALAETL